MPHSNSQNADKELLRRMPQADEATRKKISRLLDLVIRTDEDTLKIFIEYLEAKDNEPKRKNILASIPPKKRARFKKFAITMSKLIIKKE